MPRRVLIIEPAGLLWGSERALLDFVDEIPDWQVACCCPKNSPIIEKLRQKNIPCYPWLLGNLHLRGRFARFATLCGLASAIAKFRPDILYVNQAGVSKLALIACRVFGIRCVVHVRLREDVDYLNRLRPSARYVPEIIATSCPIADLLRSQSNLAKIRITTLLDTYRLRVRSLEGQADFKLARVRTWDFVCVGRFCEEKGQGHLVRAIKVLHEGGIRASLVLVGGINQYAKELVELVDSYELSKFISFAGHQDDVFPFLEQSRWLVCASDYEALGRTIFEAWDAGIPVIAGVGSGGAESSIRSSGGGLLYSAWTIEAIASQLSIALDTSAQDVVSFVSNGRQWLAQAASPSKYGRAMSDIFDAAAE